MWFVLCRRTCLRSADTSSVNCSSRDSFDRFTITFELQWDKRTRASVYEPSWHVSGPAPPIIGGAYRESEEEVSHIALQFSASAAMSRGEVVRAGYLTKSPPEGRLGQWQKRWFVFADSHLAYPLAPRYVRMEYYQNEEDAEMCRNPKGGSANLSLGLEAWAVGGRHCDVCWYR